MKVLHIMVENLLEPTGGLGVAVDDLTKETAKLGVQNTILCLDPKNPVFKDIQDNGRRIIYADCTTHGLIQEPFKYQRILYPGMINTIAFALKNEKFDLIHLHDTVAWQVGNFCRHLFECRIIMTAHLSFGIENGGNIPDYRHVHDAQEELAALQVCNLTAPSKAYAELIKKYFGLEKPIRAIANGVNLEKIEKAQPVDLKDICQDRTPVYFCGRTVESKGLRQVLDAAEALPEYHFLIFANQAPHYEDVSPLIRLLKSANYFMDNVTWFRNHPTQQQFGHLKSCAMALVPSLNDAPFELTGLEAMAAGVPLITTGKCGIAEYANESNCTLIEPTTESLIAAIKSHKRDNAKVERAKETASRFTWQMAAREYVQLYNEVFYAEQDMAA